MTVTKRHKTFHATNNKEIEKRRQEFISGNKLIVGAGGSLL
jgi:hypothetical protein